MDEKQLAK